MWAQIGPYKICHQAFFKLSILCMLIVKVSTGPRYSSRIVETKTGAIRGVILELNSRHLEPVEVFKSVPYAASPTDNFRFEPPQKLSPWKGTKLADSFGPVCPQNYPDISNRTAALLIMPRGRYQHLKKLLPMLANQSEDCLTLSIYVPGSGNRGFEAPYAVFFYIHGESFEWGSGNPIDGSILASYGHVIAITVNFRLGILGFLKTRASSIPGSGGNLGLLDIYAALEWTKENIASFGGDPNRITIVGHDTGAVLANLVLISRVGKNLVNRAVLLSGSALSSWAFINDPDMVREEVSNQMACHLDPAINSNKTNSGKTNKKFRPDDITKCLKNKPLEALMGIQLPSIRFMPTLGPFLPLEDSLDPEFAMEHSGEGFITSELIIGVTTTESYADFNSADIQYGLEEEQRNRLLRTYIRNAYSFHLNEIFSAVRNEYTDWDKPVQHPINIRDSTMEALSDGHTVSPLIRVGYLHARRGAKTYFFHFAYQTKDSEYPQRLSSVRGEDISYVFGLPLVQGMPYFPQNFSRQDMGVAEGVLNFITNFCKTGDPNEAGHKETIHPDYGSAKEKTRYKEITWETYEVTTQHYLSISLKPKMKSHYRGHKMALWLNLIPQLHQPGDSEISMRHHHFKEREPHFYAGSVRADSLKKPKIHFSNGILNEVQESRQENYGFECTPDPTMGEALQDAEEDALTEDEEVLLQKLANRHYYSYTAALGVTVGVGCLLLILNMLIFAGIYYQRDKSKQKIRNKASSNSSGTTPDANEIPLTTRPVNSTCSNSKKQHEPPPSYTTIQQKSPSVHKKEISTINKNMCDSYQQQNSPTQQHPQSSSQQSVIVSNHSKHHHHHHHHHQQQNKCQQPHNEYQQLEAHSNYGTINKKHGQPPLPPCRSSSNPQPKVMHPASNQFDLQQSTSLTTTTSAVALTSTAIPPTVTTSTLKSNNQKKSNTNNGSNSNTLKKRVQIQEPVV